MAILGDVILGVGQYISAAPSSEIQSLLLESSETNSPGTGEVAILLTVDTYYFQRWSSIFSSLIFVPFMSRYVF